jgi:hypothetical protein
MGKKKWCLIFQIPGSTTLFVLGSHKDGLKLMPVERGVYTEIEGAFGFDTELEASQWMAETASLSAHGAKLMKTTRPFLATSLKP